MFARKSSRPQNRIDSLIGAGTRIEGNVSFKGGLRIDGEVCGSVSAQADGASTLVLSEKAHIEGEVRVSHFVVNGTVIGPVYACETLELQAHSCVKGDVHYRTLEMHLGAVLEGRLVHESGEGKAIELKLASSGPQP